MTIRKDKKYESWVTRPKISKEVKAKAFYKLAKPKTSSNDSMVELTNSIIKRKARKAERTRKFADAVIADAKQKFERDHTGLPSILVADASNKPPTLEEYVKLGLQLSQLSQAERESIQFMLNKLKDREEDK
tara:strand:- start:1525 stop:1920 length:396 start_codon:yes stop_codon:yes gene_type:complete